jgi:hypothetical protein
MTSPYAGLAKEDWAEKTRELIKIHPLSPKEIYEVVIQVWREIFESNLTSKNYKIGVDLFPSPQIMGYFLHELIPLELARRYPGIWRREETAAEKDLVYLLDDGFSIEIKASSSKGSTYGNRSFAQESTTGREGKKNKSGYYLVVNFQKFNTNIQGSQLPQIHLVRFGWLDREDWQGQKTENGQKATLSRDVETYKLLDLLTLK